MSLVIPSHRWASGASASPSRLLRKSPICALVFELPEAGYAHSRVANSVGRVACGAGCCSPLDDHAIPTLGNAVHTAFSSCFSTAPCTGAAARGWQQPDVAACQTRRAAANGTSNIHPTGFTVQSEPANAHHGGV